MKTLSIIFLLLWLSIVALSQEIYNQADTTLARQYYDTGIAYMDKGRYDTAAFYFTKAGGIYKEAAAWLPYMIAVNDAGEAYNYLSNYEAAMEAIQTALATGLEHLGEDHPEVGESYANIGWQYAEKYGDYEKALLYYHKATDIWVKAWGENHPHVAIMYGNISVEHMLRGDYEKALFYRKKSLSIGLQIAGENSYEVAFDYNGLGYICQLKRDYQQALAYYMRSLNTLKNIYQEDNGFMSTIYTSIGQCYLEMEDYDLSLGYLKKALEVRVKMYGKESSYAARAYRNIGSYFFSIKNWEIALEHYQEALIILSDNFDDKNIYHNPVPEQLTLKVTLLEILQKKALTFEMKHRQTQRQKDLQQAFSIYQLSIGMVDSLRYHFTMESTKERFLGRFIPVYEGGIRVAQQLFNITDEEKYLYQAFDFAEKSKAILLLESLKDNEAKLFAGIPDSLQAKENDIKTKLVLYEQKLREAKKKNDSVDVLDHQNKLFDIRKAHEMLIKTLEEKYPRYHQLKYTYQTAGVADIQQALPDTNTAFIEYFAGDSAFYIFAITKAGLIVHKALQADSISLYISKIRDMVTHEPRGSVKDNFRQYTYMAFNLYKALLSPALKATVANYDKLIIAPDGMISYLPFEILIEATPSEKISFQQLPYLIHHYQISYAYSATLLMENMKIHKEVPDRQCLAFAPAYKGKEATLAQRGALNTLRSTSAPLSGAQQEVQAIARYLKGDFFFDKEATEKNFKRQAPHYGVIHLAMHGNDNDENPMLSKLIFTASEDSLEDGQLHTYELYNMDLKADLVVLSACETGTGKYVRGEGIMSLARGFMYAGIPSVVLTLWSIEDQASAKLMTYFYENLSQGISKEKSLQQAKKQYIKDSDELSAYPFYWAGFVLAGNTNPLRMKKENNQWLWVLLGTIIIAILAFWLIRKRRHGEMKEA